MGLGLGAHPSAVLCLITHATDPETLHLPQACFSSTRDSLPHGDHLRLPKHWLLNIRSGFSISCYPKGRMNFFANTVASQKRQYGAVERKVKQQRST